jgi:hypothetical protein
MLKKHVFFRIIVWHFYKYMPWFIYLLRVDPVQPDIARAMSAGYSDHLALL